MSRIENWILGVRNNESYIDTTRRMHYTQLKDYSSWNLRHNLGVIAFLTLKAIAVPAYNGLRVYEVRTPYLTGFLRKGHAKNSYAFLDFQFEVKGSDYSLTCFTPDKESADKFISMLASIQPVSDIDEVYRMLEDQYIHKDKVEYPADLLLTSLISIKRPTSAIMKELLRAGKNIPDNKVAIDAINSEIAFLNSESNKNGETVIEQ